MKKLFTLLTLAVLAMGSAWAAKSVDVSFVGYDRSQNPVVQKSSDETVSISISKFAGTNSGYIKCANETEIAITAPTGSSITKVVLTLGGGSSTTDININITNNSQWENPFGKNQKNGDFIWENAENTLSSMTFTLESTNASSEIRITKIAVTYDDGTVETKVDTPKISPDVDTEYNGNITVSISCATDDAAILYSYDGTSYEAYTAALTLTETKTIWAKATKTGLEDSDVAGPLTFTYVPEGEVSAVTSKVWKFDDLADGDIKIVKTVDNLKYLNSSSKYVTIAAGGATYTDEDESISFAKRVKLNGASSSAERLLQFKVAGPCTIKVYAASGSSGNAREVQLFKGSYETKVANKNVDTLDKLEYTYEGNSEESFFVGGGANIAIFGIVVEASSASMTITAAGYATFSNANEVEIPAGVTAYYAQKKDAETITLKEITGGYIPANTGVVVAGEAKTYSANITSTGATLGADNLLKPWLTAGTPTETEYYTLAAGPTFKKSTGGTLAAGKAYLVLPSEARELKVVFGGETTAINSMDNEQCTMNSGIYDLQGRRMDSSRFTPHASLAKKGVYIVGGRKVIVK